MTAEVLELYGISEAEVQSFGNGLIHRTWLVTAPGGRYILQKIHDGVFKCPTDIAFNIQLVGDYLKDKHPEYFFVRPERTTSGDDLLRIEGDGYYRLFRFVEGSQSVDAVENAGQAFEAAAAFGKFTRMLSEFDAQKLRTTIPQFHDLELRFQQFTESLDKGSSERINQSRHLILEVNRNKDIVEEYRAIKGDSAFKLRVTHHDTKINNVLFDKNETAICVIDLDTLMPGYFISDVGDMMRTYLSPVSEEEKDFNKINVREEIYEAIVQGYATEMKAELTRSEMDHFFYAGKFMIYMQALRFLTDHLNNDVYYGAKYPDHNFVRAGNQLVLLQRLIEKEKSFSV